MENHPDRREFDMSKIGFRSLPVVLFCLISTLLSYGQGQPSNIEELKKTAPKIYIDCDWCDIEYIKTEITFVNYVRDRKEAQVHVLITIQSTGSGGREYTLTYMGQLDYAGQDDLLKYYSNKTDTEDEIRKGLVQTLKVGLMRYVAKTPISKRIAISLMDQVKPTSVIDRWNFWVFSLSGRGYFNGQQSILYNSLSGSFSANRVTPELKIRTSVSAGHYLNKFEIEGETIKSTLSSERFSAMVVKSLGEHWSVGGYFSLASSSYSNIQISANPAPAIEYDIFPYSQSTRRQLRFLYRLNFTAVKYQEETIYLKTKEKLWSEALSVALELKEKWGTISTSLEGSQYFHDFSKYHVSLYGEISLRLYKGLSFEVYGSGSRIHDQLSLPKLGASYEDILLMRKQLATSYEYYFSVGLSYTWGSIYSNVVNPRFGSESYYYSSIY
jgi:hypothetical protein